MTKTTTVASKAFVAVVAAAMVFTLIAPAAKAATAEELQAQIAALMTQISALQGSGNTTTTTTTTTSTCVGIPAPLTMNATGASVTALQNWLIKAGQSIPAGATGYFGGQTRAALASWQSANGVMPAVGYYGPITAAAVAAKCVPTTPTTPTNPGTGTGTTPTTPGGSTSLKGEASLDTFEVDSASDDTIEEGDEETEIGTITVNFADGDAEISRLDLALTKTVGDAWDAFESVQLVVDGDVVAEVDASSKDDYLGDEDNGVLRFSDLGLVAMEDEDLEITVTATLQGNLDAAELGTWTLGADSLRFFDADDVATTDSDAPVTDDTVTFTIEVAGADDEIIVRENDENPTAATLELFDNKKSDSFNIFTFDIDTDDSTNDIELDRVDVSLVFTEDASTTVIASYNNLIDDVELVIDGVVIDDVSVLSGSTTIPGTVVLRFNIDGDVTIDAGERVEAKLNVTFKSLALGNEGARITASVNGANINGEGADSLSGTGSDTGEIMTLRTSGLSIDQTDTTSSVVNSTIAVTDSYGKFTSTVEITAIGDTDLYIGKSAVRGSSSTASVAYVIEDENDVVVATGTSLATFERVSGGTVSGNFTKISGNGGAATFKLTVTSFNPTVSGNFKVQILSVGFAESAAVADKSEVATPDYDFDTESAEFIQS